MITLFIDSSTNTLNLSLIKDDNVIETSSINSKEHSKYIMPEIERLFINNHIDPKEVKKIMVTNGPGSFTGIRIGVTIAKTYAWACNIKVVPISTLKAIALSSNNYAYYVPLIDARRGYVYASILDKDYNEILCDSYINLDELMKKVETLNNSVYLSNEEIKGLNTEKYEINFQRIYDYYKNEEGINPHALLPNYLKKTEAEEKFGDVND